MRSRRTCSNQKAFFHPVSLMFPNGCIRTNSEREGDYVPRYFLNSHWDLYAFAISSHSTFYHLQRFWSKILIKPDDQKILTATFQWASSLEHMSMIAVVRLRLLCVQTSSQSMRKKFCWVQKHSKRVMGYRVCQLILCHNNILIGDWQSL